MTHSIHVPQLNGISVVCQTYGRILIRSSYIRRCVVVTIAIAVVVAVVLVATCLFK